jgi:hypothetical protein
MTHVHAQQTLRRNQALGRVALVVSAAGILIGLRLIDPQSSAWLFRTSCGAFTGLPCLFCGTTRAMHHLLNGELSRAIYFNWLALPILFSAIVLMLMFTIEAALGRRVLQRRISFRVTSRRFAAIAGGLVALWILQITLAVSFHKHELLNPSGPLYSLFVR